jgi:mono/diheme cytochrome c family protein
VVRWRSAILTVGLFGLGCGPSRVVAPSGAAPHLGDAWYDHRAAQLDISPAEARARDAALSVESPPPMDDALRAEAAAIWASACASCHGADGDPATAPVQLDPPPKSWTGMGPTMGFTFGGDSMRAGIFRRIAEGGEARPDGTPSPMMGWRAQLSNEQLWALVVQIEAF